MYNILDEFEFQPDGQLTVELAALERLTCTLGSLLTHLRQRLIGELIVYSGMRRLFIIYPSTFSNDSPEVMRQILFI